MPLPVGLEVAHDADDVNASNLNGGAFLPGSGGTDYSKGASKTLIIYTDLVIVTGNRLSSAGRPFVSGDVGNVINIISGTGFTAGRYYIQSVSGGQATLDASPGTTGSTGGNARLGGCFADPTYATSVFPAGNRFLYKQLAGGAAYIIPNIRRSLSASNEWWGVPSETKNTILEGYINSPGDGTIGCAKFKLSPSIPTSGLPWPVLLYRSSSTSYVTYKFLEIDVERHAALSYIFYQDAKCFGCRVKNALSESFTNTFAVSCESVIDGARAGIGFASNGGYYYCVAKNNSIGFQGGYPASFCIAISCSTGFVVGLFGGTSHCTAYLCNVGFDVGVAESRYSLAHTCTTGFTFTNKVPDNLNNLMQWGCTTVSSPGYSTITSLGADPLTNPGAGDFSPKSGAAGNALQGLPVVAAYGVTFSPLWVGAVPGVASSGGAPMIGSRIGKAA